jgi:hypothetical protein
MPYILATDRERIDAGETPATPGELNYALTRLCLQYLGDEFNYQCCNDVIGALECCKLELYRRKVGPYEDTKIALNGDVY